jgi:hypothetical protein
MVLIKRLSLSNWNDEVRLPDNILAVRKKNTRHAGEVGIIRQCFNDIPYERACEFEIVTVTGRIFGRFEGLEALILRWQHLFDFYYIEIKP